MDRTRIRRSTQAAIIGAAVVVAMAIAWTGVASAQVSFRIDGRGFGHGIGMSQWGAHGLAQQGRGHRQILRHYYRGTRIREAEARRVRVLLANRSRASFTNARRACGRNLRPARTFGARLAPNGRRVVLVGARGRRITGCGRALRARSARGGITISDKGRYRGALVARPADGGLNVINAVGLEGYVRGVVPVEVPASWPGAALRAQAVAARTYGLASRRSGGQFHLFDDVRSQVYGGIGVETPATNRAVRRTRGQVVRHDGEIITTFYFSTSGGRTEAIENAWPGSSPQPYLKSVRDPFDDVSPVHRWRVTMTRGQVESRLGGLVRGRLRNIRVVERGDSPRIVRARIIGSDGTTTATGPELRSRLGLRSTWATFRRISG